ncbi:aldo/keto reductase [Actinocatenispora sera]|uniref:aldo/keto reductase n=1 Tax=Actinocatenispora sera TaxID=390989 RepID=UPI00340FE5A4
MRYRRFGPTGLRVSELVLGAMTFGEQGGVGASPEECRRILDAYADAGGNMIDTAINYRGGASEQIVGELLAGRRDRFVLATKYTVTRDATDPNGGGNHRKNLRLSLETSLRRLRTDHVDVYWVHLWDRHTPVEETMRALDDAVTAGTVLYVGISDAPAWVVARANTLAQWRGWTGFAGLQVPYSLLQRDAERELLPMAAAFGMAVTAWSPLGGGVLSGKYASAGAPGPTRLDPGSIDPHDRAIARVVQAVADEIGATAAQVALAWTRVRSPAVLPMIGARTVAQLVDNLGCLEVSLEPEQVRRLEAATGFAPGFPTEFIEQTTPWVFGAAAI